eukprot:COSAG05_NODE_7796_length_769_cov_0.992537_1_plen_56_part_10
MLLRDLLLVPATDVAAAAVAAAAADAASAADAAVFNVLATTEIYTADESDEADLDA